MTASEVTAKLADSLAEALPLLMRLGMVSSLLVQAHAEKWAEDDPRFAELWETTSADIDKAVVMLKGMKGE